MKDITKFFETKTKITYKLYIIPLFIMFVFLNILFVRFIDNSIQTINGVSELEFVEAVRSAIFLLLPISFFMALIFFFNTYYISGISSEFNIFTLKSDVRTKGQMSGSFFLGCGSITGSSEEIDYYVFYKEGEFGLIKGKLEAYDIEVVQTNKVEPSYKEVWVENEIRNFLFVPKNTIMRKITID